MNAAECLPCTIAWAKDTLRRRKWYLMAAVLFAADLHAQTPTAATQPPYNQTVHSTAYNLTSAPDNYIITWDVKRSFKLESDVKSIYRTVDEEVQTKQYFDGLGRPMQTVVEDITPAGNDLVTPFEYDQFGREVYKYLPYPATTSDGNLKTNAFSDQSAALKTIPTFADNGENFFYGKTDYEASPLNRVTKTYAPGNTSVGSGKGVGTQYVVNAEADIVI